MRAKLSKRDVLAIRQAWPALSIDKLARRYGCSNTTIHHALRGISWANLPGAKPGVPRPPRTTPPPRCWTEDTTDSRLTRTTQSASIGTKGDQP